jgi:MFS transporter, SHS family, lactate transporter
MSSEKYLERAGSQQTHDAPENMSIGRYCATRVTTLKPPMDKVPNPFQLLALLNTQQWLFFTVAFIAW